MDIFRLLKKRTPVLMRCTYCYEEMDFSAKQVRMLMAKNTYDPVCSIKEECHYCHIGFVIPVKYKDNSGNTFLFHEIKPKIKNLDPNTVMERIFQLHDDETITFFGPFT